MTDAEDDRPAAVETVLDRMLAAGISEDRARAHLARGVMRHEGQTVTDPDHPAPWPSRVVVGPE